MVTHRMRTDFELQGVRVDVLDSPSASAVGQRLNVEETTLQVRSVTSGGAAAAGGGFGGGAVVANVANVASQLGFGGLASKLTSINLQPSLQQPLGGLFSKVSNGLLKRGNQ